MKKKMNGILVGLIVITVLFGVLAPVQALGVSFTISGQVFDTDGTTPVDGVTMTVTDLETGSKVNTEVTAQGGWYSINLGNLKPDSTHNAGDTIQIHADNGAGKTNTTNVSRAESSPQRGVNVILEGGEEPVLTTIDVTPSTKTLNIDDTQEFNATAKDQDGNVMPDVVITWTSSNETVGTITGAGVLTALVVGTTTVTAANETVNGTAAVTVQSGVQPVLTTIEVSPSTATLNVNATKKFNATAKDQDGNVMPDVVITWTSSNETVGTITDAGVLTALVVGETTVTAANGTVNGTAAVTVQEVVPQNLTVTNLKADPNTGVNEDNPTTVSATITSSAELEMITLFAIDAKNYQPKDYMLYAEFLEPKVGTDNYSSEWDATEFTVQGETTSSGTKPVFVIKADELETILIPEYLVIGNLTINATTEPKSALALFNDAFELTEIKTEVNASSFVPGTTTFTPFAVDATERANMTDTFDLLWCFEDLEPVTLTGAAPGYNISLVKEPVLKGDYVVGMGAMDAAGDEDDEETTVSVSTTEDYAVSISADAAGKTVAPNVKATYTLTVQNDGTKTDNYTLSLTREDADHAELGRVNITNLSAGETQDVSLNVSDELVGTYTVNVTVKSLTESTVTDVVSTLTTVKTTPTPTPRKRGGGGGGGGVSDSDGDGYSDIEEIIVGTDPYDPCDPNPACAACIGEAIIAKVITTPEPTPYDPTKGITPPTTKPVATIPPLEEPEKPEKTPVPGFEAVFAIAGLLAVAYLVQRRKK